MKWHPDDAGDLVNLDQMDMIVLAPIDEAAQDAPEGHTYEVLAMKEDKFSARLTSGTEEVCKGFLLGLTMKLTDWTSDASGS